MNSDQLKQFKAIAECGNITRAAEKLYITQPSLSIALGKLEEEIGRPLFIRDGRKLRITDDGKTLLSYANTICGMVDKAEKHFRLQKHSHYIRLYRIGGVSLPRLTEGCYALKEYRLDCTLVRNHEIPLIVSSGISDMIISDEKYINLSTTNDMEKVPLFHQRLLLSVEKDDPLSQYNEIPIEMLHNKSIVGRSNPYGFNDWIDEIKSENQCEFSDEIRIDNVTYFNEWAQIPWPILLGSFGIGIPRDKGYFEKRKLIRVIGKYCERDINLYYNRRDKQRLEPMVKMILGNAERIDAIDKEIDIVYGI